MQDLVWDIWGKDQRSMKVAREGEGIGRRREKGVEGACHL